MIRMASPDAAWPKHFFRRISKLHEKMAANKDKAAAHQETHDSAHQKVAYKNYLLLFGRSNQLFGLCIGLLFNPKIPDRSYYNRFSRNQIKLSHMYTMQWHHKNLIIHLVIVLLPNWRVV